MDFIREYGLWIMIGIVLFLVLIGVPAYYLYKAYKIRQYGGGDFVLFWKVTPNGTHISPKIKRIDRNRILDKKTIEYDENGTTAVKKEPFTYLAEDGKTPVTMFPFFASKFFQISIAMAFFVDGDNHCIDLLREYRERSGLPLRNTDNAAVVQQMRNEQSGRALLLAGNPDANKGGLPIKGWMLAIAGVAVAICFIVMLWQMSQMGGKIDQLAALWQTQQLP
jgi:hypothetical protein